MDKYRFKMNGWKSIIQTNERKEKQTWISHTYIRPNSINLKKVIRGSDGQYQRLTEQILSLTLMHRMKAQQSS